MIRKARLPVPAFRFGRVDAESVPGLAILGMNAVGLALVGTLVADEIDNTRELAAASVPDLEPHAEEQPQQYAAIATAGIHSYRFEARATPPAHEAAAPPLYGERPGAEVWS